MNRGAALTPRGRIFMPYEGARRVAPRSQQFVNVIYRLLLRVAEVTAQAIPELTVPSRRLVIVQRLYRGDRAVIRRKKE